MTRRVLGSVVARLRRDERGVALVEFAFGAPVLLFLILAGLELANYALAQLRVNQIAMTVADNAGRVMTGIDEANIYEVFAGARVIGEPLGFEENGRIVLSSLQANGITGNGAGQMINWQRCWGALDVDPAYGVQGDGRQDDTLAAGMGAGGNRIYSDPDTAVMVAEVSYDYQPLISSSILPLTARIRHESAFNVRGRQNNNISNTQSLATLACGSGATPSGGGSSGGSSGSGSSGGGGNGNAGNSGGTNNGNNGKGGGNNGGGNNGNGNGH